LSADADQDLSSNPRWGTLLSSILAKLSAQYDEGYIDTNPSLGKLTRNGFHAATDVLIPSTAENWSVQGMIKLTQVLMEARQINPNLNIAGILFSRVRYASHRELMLNVRNDLVPRINEMFDTSREDDEDGLLDGLQIDCFEHYISESKLFSDVTAVRANLLLAQPYSVPALETWQCYMELLVRTNGSGQQESIDYYNGLVEKYTQAQEREEARKQARQRAKVAGGEK
jgi:cellulose biosynthesis protein BcsQ